MTIRNILMFIGDFIIISGLYQFYFSFIIKKGYKYLGDENKSLMDYICKEYPTKTWEKRRKNKHFSLERYFLIRKTLGLGLILLGLIIFVVIWWFSGTKYGFMLDVKL